MPGVDIYYQHGSMERPVAERIIEVVRSYGYDNFFSGAGRLHYGDFSFKFHEPHRFDELSDEIIVRMGVRQLHAGRTLDDHARSLAQLIAENIGRQVFGTIGAELRHEGRTGWGVAELFGARPEKVWVAAED